MTFTPFSKWQFWEGKTFLVQSAAQKFAKNDRLDALIVLARDEQFLCFPSKWFKGGTIGWFFSIFCFVKPYKFATLSIFPKLSLNSTAKAEVSLISILSSHPPTRQPTHSPRTVVSKTSSGLLLLNFNTTLRLIHYLFKANSRLF